MIDYHPLHFSYLKKFEAIQKQLMKNCKWKKTLIQIKSSFLDSKLLAREINIKRKINLIENYYLKNDDFPKEKRERISDLINCYLKNIHKYKKRIKRRLRKYNTIIVNNYVRLFIVKDVNALVAITAILINWICIRAYRIL